MTRIERARLVEQAGQGARVRVSLAQPGPVHALRLPLQLVAGDRVETRVVEFAAGRTDVELTAGFVPEGVALDPELRLWRLPEAAQLPPILRQWIVAAAPRLVLADAQAEAGGAGSGAVSGAGSGGGSGAGSEIGRAHV